MYRIDRLAAVGAVAIGLGSAGPLWAQSFDVPAGSLGDVASRIGAQSGATVTVPDPELAGRRSPGVRGRVSLREALRRALTGTGAEARFFDARTVRIVRARAKTAKVRPPRPPHRVAAPPPPPPPTIEAIEEIVVTGSKGRTALDRYPGSVNVVEMDRGWQASNGTDGASAIVRLLPSLSATNLGRGREKIFIRGVADSSFNGPTQSATGQYLGDVRLTYNAPDPSLNLYDMQRVEVLVGPQAPLYGAGSLGGVIRFVPHTPDLDRFAGSASTMIEHTRGGGFGSELNAMLNVPLATDRWGLRVTASAGRRPGYIDAPGQGARNINPTRSNGHRIALRGDDLDGWTLDIGHVRQHVESDAGQYIVRDRGEPMVGQPFKSNYQLVYLRAEKPIGDAELVSTTAAVRHNLRTYFEASALFEIPGWYEEKSRISILSHESRIAGGSSRAPWVVGVSAIYSHSLISQGLGVIDIPLIEISSVDSNLDAALYGRVTVPLTRTLSMTAGGRLTYARTESYVRDPQPDDPTKSFRQGARFSRTLALDWQPGGAFSAFLRHDQGFRAGGLTAYPTLIGLVAQTYRPDTLDLYELGIRIGRTDRDSLSFRAAIFRNIWHNMQADLIDITGFPYTANVGNGRIFGVDAELRWRPVRDVSLTAAAFVNNSRLAATEAVGPTGDGQPLPNVAGVGGRLAAEWRREIGPGMTLNGRASVRYVGRSRLGVGSALDVPQGGYGVIDIGAGLDFGRAILSLHLDNAANAKANTFAFGNPFSVVRRDQMTPLRPRTIRLGLDLSF